MHPTTDGDRGEIRNRKFAAASFPPTKEVSGCLRSLGDRDLDCLLGWNHPPLPAPMDWYPTFATFAGIKVPPSRVIDGRDLAPLLKGETQFVPAPGMKKSLNADVPLRRTWNPGGEWKEIIPRLLNTMMLFSITGAKGLVCRSLAKLEDVFESEFGIV